MQGLIVYILWTFISSALFKGSVDIILNKNIGYLPAFIFCIFLQVLIVFPLMALFNAVFKELRK